MIQRMMIVFLLTLSFLSQHGHAQLSAIRLKNSEVEKPFQNSIVEFNGMRALVGEILSDLNATQETHLKLKLLNPSDPKSKGKEVKVAKSDLNTNNPIIIVSQRETLETLSAEYEIRIKQIEKLQKLKSSLKKPSAEWQRNIFSILSQKESLASWLESYYFKSSAAKLNKEIQSDKNSLSEFMMEWEQDSISKINTQLQTPEKLNLASQEISSGAAKFSVAESPHFRIVYLDSFSDSSARVLNKDEVTNLLNTAEKALGFFRREVVLRNLDSTKVDPFSDKAVFVEFFFGPTGPENSFYRDFLTRYYKQNWGDNEAEKIKLSGTRFANPGSKGVETYFVYSKLLMGSDLKGKILHSLGHIFANVFYNQNRFENPPQPWLEEAIAYWLSFELSGNNSETCVSFDKKRYASANSKANNLELIKGFRTTLSLLAKENKRSIDSLMGTRLIDMEDSDIAKAFYLYSYLLNKSGPESEKWLIESCSPKYRTRKVSGDPSAVTLDTGGEFRNLTESLFGSKLKSFKTGVDVYKALESDFLDSVR